MQNAAKTRVARIINASGTVDGRTRQDSATSAHSALVPRLVRSTLSVKRLKAMLAGLHPGWV